MVQPADRAAWRTWLMASHDVSRGVWLATFRPSSGRARLDYESAVEEALCVGWIDSKTQVLDDERGIQWFSPRSRRSAWSGSNKARVARLEAAGLMLPAGLAAIEEAKRLGTWTMLDDVEQLVVPPDLASAFDAHPPARDNWDAFSRSSRRAILAWIVDAVRPETRAKRIDETARLAARNEKAGQPKPKEQAST
ncbi:MAG: YdeI family protein [Candidatus Limnocylindrales bacterium]|jgi:uncharacterized protein YdeI (YjbR/CyaY-like superfamily)